jgi:SAM-dependent MidA family methyltransferase
MPTIPAAALPIPAPEASLHSARLIDAICDEIAANDGWISFARYMELALYAPGLGYYTAGSHKFGETGDFVTAPELSSLFGRTLARQVSEIMTHSSPHILELGAGSGKLAGDLLAELEKQGHLPETYCILEVSADLRARQQTALQQRLPHLYQRFHWLDTLPEQFSGAIIANEVLDALPVHRVHWQDSGLTEFGVSLNNSGFIWNERPIADPALLQAAQKIDVPDDYVSEICLAARGLINSLAQRLGQGAMLFIDYGFGAREFYHPQRNNGTLMCHYRHRAHDDPFYLPGLQDITAHVNFTDIAETALDAGLALAGYTSQAFFLINCGITGLLEDTSPDDLKTYLPLSAELQKLTSPAEMGELFKVIAFSKNLSLPLCGFASGDLSRLL